MATAKPANPEEVIDLVRAGSALMAKGGGTKPSLWEVAGSTMLIDMTGMSGIVEYLPSEYTITVKSGTRLQTMVEALRKNGQYLPFDPPLADPGATIGGTVAAGLSGPGAYRYGPLKDFIIGVRFVDGLGNHVRGGGNVVKNAAGFDFPKLFNGSLGRLGILTEITFKVFPQPRHHATLQARLQSLEEGALIMPKLKGFDLEGVELDSTYLLSLRLGYQQATMAARQHALEALVGKPLRLVHDGEEQTIWDNFKRFSWLGKSQSLFKVATHPASALRLIRSLNAPPWQFHLGNGGKALYLAGEEGSDIESLNGLLRAQKLTGLQLKGPVSSHPLIGKFTGSSFVRRLQRALDPNGIFPSFSPSD